MDERSRAPGDRSGMRGRVLPKEFFPTKWLSSQAGVLLPRVLLDSRHQLLEETSLLLDGEVGPAGKGRELHLIFLRVGLGGASAPKLACPILGCAIEPGSDDPLSAQEGAHAVRTRPVGGASHQAFLGSLGEEVAQALNLGPSIHHGNLASASSEHLFAPTTEA